MERAARAANQANFYKNLAIMAAYLLLAITGERAVAVEQAKLSPRQRAIVDARLAGRDPAQPLH